MKPLSKTLPVVAGLILIAFLLGRSCSSPEPMEPSDMSSSPAAETWTCSMHPQILQPDPGDCPICGMDLIPLTSDSDDTGPREMKMSESAMALAEIETVKVKRMFPERETRLVGRLTVDETRERRLTARFPARVETLYVNYEGIAVKRGEHLAQVYSPELFAAQAELLSAHRHNPDSAVTRAAKEKLRLWDLLPEQVDGILQRGAADERMDIKAPVGGVVVEQHVKEGDYVKTGQPMFRIADLHVLWLKMEAYESDLLWLRYGQDVTFTVEAFPGETFTGTIAFIEPLVDPQTRTVQIRVNVDNADGQLKPGMFARGIVHSALAEGGKIHAPDLAGKWISPMHPSIVKDGPGSCDICGMDLVPASTLGYQSGETSTPPLVIPASAVLNTGRRSIVYVQRKENDQTIFEGRDIILGPRAGDVYVVLEGLEEGDVVASHGVFKIDSALQIQGKLSMMHPDAVSEVPPELNIDTQLAATVLPHYLRLQEALAADHLDSALEALKSMLEAVGHEGPLADFLHPLLSADNLDTLRRPHFETLSNALIQEVQTNPDGFDNLHLMNCPMVYDDRGADWLQDSSELRNPYFGSSMLYCGTEKELVPAQQPEEHIHEH